MATKITLLGNPLSTNTVWRTTSKGNFQRTYLSNSGRALKESYQWQSKSQWKKPILTKAVGIEVRLYFGDKRKRDIDNYHKLSLDSLTGIVYEDDSQIQKMTVEKFYDKENPRIEIEIEEIVAKLAPHL